MWDKWIDNLAPRVVYSQLAAAVYMLLTVVKKATTRCTLLVRGTNMCHVPATGLLSCIYA